MFQLQFGALHIYPGTWLPYSPFGLGDKHVKCSLLKFKKARSACTIMANNAEVGKSFCPIRSCGDGFRRAFSCQCNLKPGQFNGLEPVNIFSSESIDNGIRLSLPSYGAFNKRYFSHGSSSAKKLDNVGVKSGGNNIAFQAFKHRKRAKALAAQSENKITDSSFSKDIEGKASSEQLVVGGKLESNNNQISKVNGKKKQRSKKGREQNPAASSPVKADVEQVSKGTAKAKNSRNMKSGQDSLQTSKVSK